MILAARGITKRYPGTLALDAVDFAVEAGQVHALVGENGAGKSTLMHILAGIEQATAGTIENPGAARIAVIHQELNLLPNLTVAENIFLAREMTRFGGIDRRAQEQATRELLGRLQQDIAPSALVGDLSLGQRQIVEIARALAFDARVVIMDEPTSALSRAEVALLFRIIGDLRAHGVGIVYISHRLEEILAIADRITVLRDGRAVASVAAAKASLPWIVASMTGGTPSANRPAAAPSAPAPILQVQSPAAAFSAARGEIVAFYGLLGAGRTELFESMMGLRTPTEVRLDGRPLTRLPIAGRIRAGLAFAPADRQTESLVPALSVRANMLLSSARGFYLSPAAEKRTASEMFRRLDIRAPGSEVPIAALSGGNQQKVVLARYLLTHPKVLLLDEPTRGVDIGARAGIYTVIRQLAAAGMAILFASSEVQEVLALATRILVMSRGRVAAEFDAATATEEALIAAC